MTAGEAGRRVHLDSGTLGPLLRRLDKQRSIRCQRPGAEEDMVQIK